MYNKNYGKRRRGPHPLLVGGASLPVSSVVMVDPALLQQVKLKATGDDARRDRSAPNYNLAVCGEVSEEKEEQRRDYFFSTGIDRWYEPLKDVTFPTQFLTMSPEEARTIVAHWKKHFQSRTSDSPAPDEDAITVPPALQALADRIDNMIRLISSPSDGVFVKLSTRSPKDSDIAFAKARKLYAEKCAALGGDLSPNDKLVLLGGVAIETLRVCCGTEAVQLLFSSTRVGEDLEYALSTGDDTFSQNVSLVVRKWVPIAMWAEFRGFVWNSALTTIGQYNHPVVFPQLRTIKDKILSDLEAFFLSVKDRIRLDKYIVDFAWTEEKVYLVEVNPFDGEIVFPASTGLWSWEKDREQMMNGPLELRIREKEEDPFILKTNIDPLWRAEIFQ